MGKSKHKSLSSHQPKTINSFYFDSGEDSLAIPENLHSPPSFKDIQGWDLSILKDDIYVDDIQIKPKEKTKSSTVSNYQLAKILAEKYIFIKYRDVLYVWDEPLLHYLHFFGEYADQFIRRNIPLNYKNRINSSSIKEINQWLRAEFANDIESSQRLVIKDELLLFKNCIINLITGHCSKPSSNYFFTSRIEANYKRFQYNNNSLFECFMEDITDGNKHLYNRTQELFGAVLSNTRSIKMIAYLIGVKDSGKTLTLKLLENILGEQYCTNLSFDQLNKPEYLAELVGKKLNTCAETSELTLNRLDILKRLSGNDPLMARPLYDSPIKFVNTALLVFAGNHLPTISSRDNLNAFSKRIEIFPFNNPTPKEKQDPNLLKKLLEEKDYIVSWATEGWRRWYENNYKFTTCKEVITISDMYNKQTNSVEAFVNDTCIFSPELKTHTYVLEQAYFDYCNQNNLSAMSITNLNQHLKSIPELHYHRFRLNNQNKYGFSGIGLI